MNLFLQKKPTTYAKDSKGIEMQIGRCVFSLYYKPTDRTNSPWHQGLRVSLDGRLIRNHPLNWRGRGEGDKKVADLFRQEFTALGCSNSTASFTSPEETGIQGARLAI